MNVEVLKTNKGGVKLVYHDYQYRIKRKNANGSITWRCCHCNAAMKTNGEPLYLNPVILGVHSHEANATMTGVLHCRQHMKSTMEQQHQPEKVSTAVYREGMLNASADVVAMIASKDYVGRSLRTVRAKVRPPLPMNAEELILAPYQTETRNNERLLLLDDVRNGDRVLVFCSDLFLNLLCAAPIVFIDGTFRTVPRIFTQFVSINFMYNEKLLPAVYALVKRKTQAIYECILEAVHNAARERGLNFRPTHCLTDFETGLMAALATSLPATQQRGCFFHFCQCCFRQIQHLGLQAVYRGNPAQRIVIRVTMALAFLPVNQIVLTFQKLEQLVNLNIPILIPYMLYFRRQWIENILPIIWNVHGHAVRTNNDLEGWHFSMKRAIDKDHTDVHSFLKWIKDEETTTRNLVVQIDAGDAQAVRKNTVYRRLGRRIEELRVGFLAGTRSRSQFLKGCAYNMARLPIENLDPVAEDENIVPHDHQGMIPWDQLDAIVGLDIHIWQPWQ